MENSMCDLSHFSCVQLFTTPWTIACLTPLSMGFSRQEHQNGLPCLPLGNPPNLGIQPTFLMFLALAGVFFTTSTTWEDDGEQYGNSLKTRNKTIIQCNNPTIEHVP